jgi:hypothetical protein
MSSSARWNLLVSRGTDSALRRFPGDERRGRKKDMSRFVEEAMQARILERAAERAKRQNTNVSPDAIADAIDEALEWARRG